MADINQLIKNYQQSPTEANLVEIEKELAKEKKKKPLQSIKSQYFGNAVLTKEYQSKTGTKKKAFSDLTVPQKRQEILELLKKQNPIVEPTGGDDKPTGGDDKPTGGDDKPTGGDDKPTGGDDKPTGGDDKPTILNDKKRMFTLFKNQLKDVKDLRSGDAYGNLGQILMNESQENAIQILKVLSQKLSDILSDKIKEGTMKKKDEYLIKNYIQNLDKTIEKGSDLNRAEFIRPVKQVYDNFGEEFVTKETSTPPIPPVGVKGGKKPKKGKSDLGALAEFVDEDPESQENKKAMEYVTTQMNEIQKKYDTTKLTREREKQIVDAIYANYWLPDADKQDVLEIFNNFKDPDVDYSFSIVEKIKTTICFSLSLVNFVVSYFFCISFI